MPMNRKPCVLAGLMATLGLGATLVAAPTVALAETAVADNATPQTISTEQGVERDTPSAASDRPDGMPVVDEGTDDGVVPDVPTASGTADHVTEDGGSESVDVPEADVPETDVPQQEDGPSLGEDVPGQVDDEPVDTEDAVGSVPSTGDKEIAPVVPNEVLSSADGAEAQAPESVAADLPQASLPEIGWEGDSYWDGTVNEDGTAKAYTGWVVDDHEGKGLQRYWVENGEKVTNRVFEIGDGTFGYALSSWVLRGVSDVIDGLVYVANNDGVLLSAGWHVGDYGQGLQRYWIDAGEHAAVVGYDDGSEGAGNWAHYTTSGGYVLRGGADLSSSSPENDGMFYADNDGRLHTSGWLVTSAFGQGLQRYWFEGGKVASVGVHKTGASSWTYTTSNGYVLRGYLPVGGLVYLADNDGNLAGGAAGGWVVSDDFGQGLQRYWIDAGEHAAVVGFSNDGWAHYTTSNGYVLRGKMKTSNGFLLADDNGCLAEGKYAAGMVVTDAFEGSLERYYLVKASDGHLYTKSGHIEYGGRHYYGSPDTGQILRGKLRYGNGMLLADNDGVLAWTEGWLVTDIYDGVLQRYRIDTAPGDGLMGARIGFFTLGGNDYYGREDEGYVVIGLYIAPSGKAYYGDNDGVLTTIPLSQVAINLWNRIKNVSSATQYLIAVDCENCHTVVFQGSAGNWTPIFDWLCGVGLPQYNNGQGTIRGEWTIGGNNSYCNWTDDPDFSEWGDPYTWQTTYFAKDDIKWYTNFCLDLGFHSTIGWDGGYSDPNQIGKKISHGCIRLLEENAKWIYYNAGYGTKVVTV